MNINHIFLSSILDISNVLNIKNLIINANSYNTYLCSVKNIYFLQYKSLLNTELSNNVY